MRRRSSLALPIHNSNFESCFRLGRNYTLAATETVRGSELLHLALREYPAADTNVKRNYSRPWRQALGFVAIDPGAARTMTRSEMLERGHSEKDRSWRPHTSRAWHIAPLKRRWGKLHSKRGE